MPIQGATLAETSGMRSRGRKLFPGRSERPQQAWSSFTGQWRLVPIGHDQRVPQLRRTGPSVKIISQTPAVGPALEDAGPEDGP